MHRRKSILYYLAIIDGLMLGKSGLRHYRHLIYKINAMAKQKTKAKSILTDTSLDFLKIISIPPLLLVLKAADRNYGSNM
jgi:hypothetical protein